MKTIAYAPDSESSRLAYWLVAAMAVLVLIVAITAIPWTPHRRDSSVVPAPAAPPTVSTPSLVGANEPGTGVPDAAAVFNTHEIAPEQPAPTF